jgi:hypothetical protein
MSKIMREVWVVGENKIPDRFGERRVRLYWNNEFGWGSPEEATTFTLEERNTFNLPMNGKWIKATLTIG